MIRLNVTGANFEPIVRLRRPEGIARIAEEVRDFATTLVGGRP